MTSGRGVLIGLLLAQVAFGLVAMTICLPSTQAWGEQFGAGQAEVQLSFSGYVFAYATLQLLYGPLSDRHGRRRVLMAGMVVGRAMVQDLFEGPERTRVMAYVGMAMGLAPPLAFAGPLILLGLGHGFSMPPALAGAAAAVAGLAQQLMGAFGGYAVGLFRHEGALSLGLLMLGFTLLAAGALGLLHASAAWRSR